MGDVVLPLQVLHDIPPDLLSREAQELEALLDRPTLIFIEGQRDPPLFLSVLLHGNETSGWDGVRNYLVDHPRRGRSIVLFIPNVVAAAAGLRALPDQQDFNRIWRNAVGPGAALASAVQAAIADHELFAAIDLHNNTGHNPYYSVVTDLDARNFGLALMFSEQAVYVEEPDTVLTRIFAGRCPAITLEVGPVGDERCTARVYDFIDRCMQLDSVPESAAADLRLFRSRARVHIRPGITFRFSGDAQVAEKTEMADEAGSGQTSRLVLTGGVEAVNFHDLPAGTPFGSTDLDLFSALQVLDVAHRDVTADYFELAGGELRLRRAVVPAMYTTDPFVVRQDCLCYFMERMS